MSSSSRHHCPVLYAFVGERDRLYVDYGQNSSSVDDGTEMDAGTRDYFRSSVLSTLQRLPAINESKVEHFKSYIRLGSLDLVAYWMAKRELCIGVVAHRGFTPASAVVVLEDISSQWEDEFGASAPASAEGSVSSLSRQSSGKSSKSVVQMVDVPLGEPAHGAGAGAGTGGSSQPGSSKKASRWKSFKASRKLKSQAGRDSMGNGGGLVEATYFAANLKSAMAKQAKPVDTANRGKVDQVKQQMEEVKVVISSNIEKVMGRGASLDRIADKSDEMLSSAMQFQAQGRRLRKKLWLQNMKLKIVILLIFLVIGALIFGFVCGGGRCFG
eukprot:jgi/Mesvir1/20753/Mv20075-RA.1